MKNLNIWYIIMAIISFLLMPLVCELAYEQRGYFAIGGEFLVPILIMLGTHLVIDFAKEMKRD